MGLVAEDPTPLDGDGFAKALRRTETSRSTPGPPLLLQRAVEKGTPQAFEFSGSSPASTAQSHTSSATEDGTASKECDFPGILKQSGVSLVTATAISDPKSGRLLLALCTQGLLSSSERRAYFDHCLNTREAASCCWKGSPGPLVPQGSTIRQCVWPTELFH